MSQRPVIIVATAMTNGDVAKIDDTLVRRVVKKPFDVNVVAEALIEACRTECAARGASRLTWQTAPDNERAMKVYDRVGGTREQWIDYWVPAGGQAARPE